MQTKKLTFQTEAGLNWTAQLFFSLAQLANFEGGADRGKWSHWGEQANGGSDALLAGLYALSLEAAARLDYRVALYDIGVFSFEQLDLDGSGFPMYLNEHLHADDIWDLIHKYSLGAERTNALVDDWIDKHLVPYVAKHQTEENSLVLRPKDGQEASNVQKFTMYLATDTASFHKPGNVCVLPFNPDENRSAYSTKALIKAFEVEVEVPKFDVIDLKVKVMEEILQKDLAESHVRQQKMRDEIAELKCIGHEKAAL